MKFHFDRVPKDRPILRPQVRQHAPENLARLADSLLKGQIQPIGLLKEFTVIWGTGRVLAARMKPEITHLTAAIFDEEISEREFQRMRFVENQLRQDLSNAEKCINAIEYAKSEPTMPLKQIAADLGVDASMVTRWLSWEKCIEPVRRAMAANQITLQAMYALSQLPQEEQAAALALALNAPNAAAAARAVRRQKNGEAEAVRLSRFKYPLPSGVEITVAGKELSISDLIEALAELTKEAKRASDQGLDIRTLVAVAKDKARKGV